MPFFQLDGRVVYYESHGNGQPLLLMNGIMMSCGSWQPFIEPLARQYRVILFDFFDQGKSARLDTVGYQQDLQATLAEELCRHLELEKVNAVGISYGAAVAMRLTINKPCLVRKLALFNCVAATSTWLREIGRGWIAAAESGCARTFYTATMPAVYSPHFFNTNRSFFNDREKILLKLFDHDFLQAMIRLVKSSESHNLRERLKQISCPTVVVSCDNDYLTPCQETEKVHQAIDNSYYIMIKNCGHASLYERPNEFLAILQGFLNNEQQLCVIQSGDNSGKKTGYKSQNH